MRKRKNIIMCVTVVVCVYVCLCVLKKTISLAQFEKIFFVFDDDDDENL